MSVDSRSAGERSAGVLLLIGGLEFVKPPFPFLCNVALLLHHSKLAFLGCCRVPFAHLRRLSDVSDRRQAHIATSRRRPIDQNGALAA